MIAPGAGPERHGDVPVVRVRSVALPGYRSFPLGLPDRAVDRTLVELPARRRPPRLTDRARRGRTAGGAKPRPADGRGLPDRHRRVRPAVRHQGRARDRTLGGTHPSAGVTDPGALDGLPPPARGARCAAACTCGAVGWSSTCSTPAEASDRLRLRCARRPRRRGRGLRRPAGGREAGASTRGDRGHPGHPAGGGRGTVRFAVAAAASPGGGLHRHAARAGARDCLRLPGRVRPHRRGRDLLPDRPGGPGQRGPGGRTGCRRPPGPRGARRDRLAVRPRRALRAAPQRDRPGPRRRSAEEVARTGPGRGVRTGLGGVVDELVDHYRAVSTHLAGGVAA